MRYLSSALVLIGGVLLCIALTAVQSNARSHTAGTSNHSAVEPDASDFFTARPVTGSAQVIVNDVELEPAVAATLAAGIGVHARAGRYWYDARSGAFGLQGKGALGVLPAGLQLGGPLRPDASGGGDGRYGGVFVNGRELHPTDVAGLQQLLGQVIPGRYWVDAYGNFGYEHGPPLGNLLTLARIRGHSAGSGPRGSRPSGCFGDTSCDTQRSWLGENYFSDGKTGCIVMDGEISC